MAKPIHREVPSDAPGFDVTVKSIIGRVDLDSTGHHSPVEAAMLLIANYPGEGEFSFPHEDGGTVTVIVSYEV